MTAMRTASVVRNTGTLPLGREPRLWQPRQCKDGRIGGTCRLGCANRTPELRRTRARVLRYLLFGGRDDTGRLVEGRRGCRLCGQVTGYGGDRRTVRKEAL